MQYSVRFAERGGINAKIKKETPAKCPSPSHSSIQSCPTAGSFRSGIRIASTNGTVTPDAPDSTMLKVAATSA
jgi:hypothetical protein